MNAGAIVVGPKPLGSRSLADDQAEFKTLADQVWGGAATAGGRVYSEQTLAEVMASLKVAPDFEYGKPQQDTSLFFVHRKLTDGDLF